MKIKHTMTQAFLISALSWPLAAGAADTHTTAGPGTAAGTMQAGDAAGTSAVSASDLDTLRQIHQTNQMEIQMGQLAQEKGSTSAVKSYGKKLVTDHTAADKKIEAYLKTKDLDLTALDTKAPPPKPSDLDGKSGVDFDKAFASQMVEGHQKAIDLVTTARDNTTDKKLKTLYSGLLPTLKKHKKIAESLMGGEKSPA